ncbi:hypothetical protein [Curtobacterium sp. MCBD17_040]|uniref:hypothetical protein n=1 Tax=Curtobacterium sp. MCBD17_040 TaxID=2175674 RepID=UPI000DA6EC57|nr:hypothetical protein [Curtobacterium sp. MCBD17_040]WIB65822.1 hypothetical protein DEI94_17050 [Curtobacterium sp. MCBD17_040]
MTDNAALVTRYTQDRDALVRQNAQNQRAIDYYNTELARLTADPSAVPAPPTTSRHDMLIALRELHERRIDAFRAGTGKGLSSTEQLELPGEATTVDDIDLLNNALGMLDEFSRTVASLREDVWREFTKGQRCGVCGRTSKQNEAIGYDCAREC